MIRLGLAERNDCRVSFFGNQFFYPGDSKFPDGTPALILAPDEKIKTVGEMNSDIWPKEEGKVACEFLWNFEDMSELFTLQCLVDKIRDEYGSKIQIDLVMPYIPNARMDRVEYSGDIFTLKTFCNIINSMNFNVVKVYNAHSNVSLALLNNVHQMEVEFDIRSIIRTCDVNCIYYPDEGAMKRYGDLNLPAEAFVFGMKNRDWATGEIKGLAVYGDTDKVAGKDVLIIDDICSRGGTFKFSAIELKKLGAKNIYLFVTHCENVIDIKALKEAGITKVYTTNTICKVEDDFVKIIEKF